MYRRYYDGYRPARSGTDTGEIIVPESSSAVTYRENQEIAEKTPENDAIEITSNQGRGFLGLPCEIDDIILIGILIFLLSESDEIDPVLIIVIGYLLLSDII